MLDVIRRLHARWVMSRRTRILADLLGGALPSRGRILDIGAGDGQIDALLMALRPGLTVEGVDILVRVETCIPVCPFDGKELPFPDRSFDWVLFVDTLHHAADPIALLAEAKRVACSGIVIKDHLREGLLDQILLTLMDWVGNRPHAVSIPNRYMNEATWRGTFLDLGLDVKTWETRLRLYPWPAGLLLNRSLHFIAKVVKV